MALYVRSTDGSDSDDGSTWALAKATLAGAFSAASAGDTIYVSQAHAETQASNMTLTSPGTESSPVKVLCVNDSAEPPTTLVTGYATGGSISTITSTYSIVLYGYTYYYGLTFNCRYIFNLGGSSEHGFSTFEKCNISLVGATSTGKVALGSSSTTYNYKTTLINTDITFSHVSQIIQITQCRFFWLGGSALSTAPTVLFSFGAPSGDAYIRGVDLSIVGSSKSLVGGLGAQERGCISISNCKLGASVSVITGTLEAGGPEVYLDVCDSADPSNGPRSEAYTYQGSVKTDTSVYRSGGASDGTAYSLKMVTNASGVSFISPLATRPIHKVASTTGSSITVTAEIIQADGSTALDESECWMEVEYMGTSGYPITSFVNDHNSTLLSASTTDQTTSTETWTGLTGTPVKQKLACSFTPQEKGYYMVRIYLARASATVYVCPKLVVS